MSTSADEPIRVRLGHSPDADDIFMWWPLASYGDQPPAIDTAPFSFELVAADIEQLNKRAEEGDLEITGISMAHYPTVSKDYALTTCGSSFGLGYGPKLVAKQDMSVDSLRENGGVVAVAGLRTSGYAVARLLLGEQGLAYEPMPFESIPLAVTSGRVDAGVVIHEGQLTYSDSGLTLVCDLGAWWQDQSGGPIPLGGNVIRRDLDRRWGPGFTQRLVQLLRQSIEFSLRHRDQALAHCLELEDQEAVSQQRRETIDQFVQLYVNELTVEMGEAGRVAIGHLIDRMSKAGIAPQGTDVAFVQPS